MNLSHDNVYYEFTTTIVTSSLL